MNDEMSQYSGVANSYKDFPLSALRQMQSILEWEIEQRLHDFGIENVEKVLGKLGDVEGENVVGKVVNLQENNVLYRQFRKGSSTQ